MSVNLVQTLVSQQSALVHALDGTDVATIETATHRLAGTLALVSSSGGWREMPDLISQLSEALRLAQAAAARVNFLTEQNRRRLERVHSARGAPATGLAYGIRGWKVA